MAWLTNLLGAVLGSFFEKLFGAVRQVFEGQQQRADQVALGQAQQAGADKDAAIAAGKRMEQAGAKPKDPSYTRKMLDEGRF